jgi:hypothetical protein
MLLELSIISAFAGIALGLRYKVVILIRAVALVMMFAMVVGIAHGDPYWSIILAIAIPATAIQLGYLAGIQMRAAIGECSYCRMLKQQPNGAPGEAPSVMVRRGRMLLEQRSGSKPLEPSAKGRFTGQRSKSAAERSK